MPEPVDKSQLIPIHLSHRECLWYYLNKTGQQFGPISFQALINDWENNKIEEESYVWNEDLDDWKRFKEVLQKTTLKS